MKLEKIHEDIRGSINILTGFSIYSEAAIFFTHQGFARGGCIHNLNDEFITVLEGEIEYVLGPVTVILKSGEHGIVPKGTPHYFKSLTDSIVIEWGATPKEKLQKHSDFRKIVDKINQEAQL
jgi:hypothetical protein